MLLTIPAKTVSSVRSMSCTLKRITTFFFFETHGPKSGFRIYQLRRLRTTYLLMIWLRFKRLYRVFSTSFQIKKISQN